MEFYIPYGSVQDPFLVITYTSTIQDVIKEDLTLNGFADEQSFRRLFNPNQTNSENMSYEDSMHLIIEDSMQGLKSWMDAVRCNLNESTTKLLHFGGHQQLVTFLSLSINIIGTTIDRFTQVKYLGGSIDSNLLFKSYIKVKYKVVMINIIRIHSIQKYTKKDTSYILILSLVISHLEYSQHTTHVSTEEVNKPNATCTELCSKCNIEQSYQR